MDSKPELEVLLALYNGELYIEEQIASILHQTEPNVQILIRDDGSTDRSLEIIEKMMRSYPTRITLLPSSCNLGIIGNFNLLLAQSKAPYLFFADCDDVWHPEKVRKSLLQMMELEKKVGKEAPLLVHTDNRVVDRELKVIADSFWNYAHLRVPEGHSFPRLLMQNVITGNSLLMNRALLKLAWPLPPDIVMHDWWIALVAAAFGHISAIHEPLLLYRQHRTNDTGAKKYSLSGFCSRLGCDKERRKIFNSRLKRDKQATFFLNRYGSQLSSDQRVMVEDFLSLRQSSWVKKVQLMRKNGFYKTGFLRNCFELLPFLGGL